MQNVNLQDIESRPQRYWTVDGLPELVMGFLWILWGVVFLIPEILPKGDWTKPFWSIAPFFLAGSGFAATWLTKRLKARYTFPRTGYVEWKKPKMEHNLSAALLGFVVAAALGVGIAMSRANDLADFIAPATGILFSAGFLFAGRRFQLPMYVWLAGASLVIGGLLYPFHLGMQSLHWLLIGVGAATTAAGFLRLRSFMKANPVEAAQ